MAQYDVVVIGAGPGGYVCAIKAAQLGLRVGVVEKRLTHGGTCLNVGCIPSKALLHASEMFHHIAHRVDALGVEVSAPTLNLEKMMAHKEATVTSNVDGVSFLLKKNKIDSFAGTGKILSAGKISITASDGATQVLETTSIVIATGSDVAGIPGVDVSIDEKVIVSSTGALALDTVPRNLIVVGGGVIGMELGSVWLRLGAKVTVIEYLDHLLGGMDADVSKQFERMMTQQGMSIRTEAKVKRVEKIATGARVTFEPVKGGEAQTVEADVVLVATGRKPYTAGLGLKDAGVELDDRGRVTIDDSFKTSVAGIYAIGDVVKGPMLAHKAEEEGAALAEILAKGHGHVNYDTIPSVVYTQPEVASVGKTERELRAAGIDYTAGTFPFAANGRARAMLATDGFVKILAEKTTDRVLGGHIIGLGAGDMIHEIAVLMEFGGSAEDLGRTCHAHPTMSEAVKEAALAAFFKPIHS